MIMVKRFMELGYQRVQGEYVKYTDYAELEFLRETACKVMQEFADELGCRPDNEVILQAIDDLKSKVADLEKQRDGLVAENVGFKSVIEAVRAVANSSSGISGWHLNGVIATWDDVLPEINDVEPEETEAAIAEIGAKAVEGLREWVMNQTGIQSDWPIEEITWYANKLRGGGV
ncbi:hypothetical protein PEC302107_36060 [Pectobacterium araliae]|uniref:hypothetical protein n=1 Tax=Pectobacterium araliae TaxID=3073862 RepID=UPI00208065A3|nr:hypothetical protein PEC302107_36060 [Pectobacterium carotovorum subsp. carotovorum]